jgi:hypothetical protein
VELLVAYLLFTLIFFVYNPCAANFAGSCRRIGDDVGELVEFIRRMRRDEAETLVLHSKMKSSSYLEVASNLGLAVKGARWTNRPHNNLSNVDGFAWHASNEDDEENRDGYMDYVGEKIQWPDGFALTDCSEYKDLLNVLDLDGKHTRRPAILMWFWRRM